MNKPIMNFAILSALLLAITAHSFGQADPSAANEQPGKLIAILKSDAPQKVKADACRDLARIGTKDAVAPLAAMLADEKLSHMARYGLETIPDPAVDDAFRDALAKLKGLPLVGVIGSIGVRHDAKAVDALTKFLQDPDPVVAQAAARALGHIGNSAAAKAIGGALANVSAANQLAFCEGLLRCAESLAASGQRDEAIAIYDRLRVMQAPYQVRAGALHGAIITRQKEGLPLLKEHLGSNDYVLFATAVRTSQEMPGTDVTQLLTAALGQLPADSQILLIQALGKRADPSALPTLFALAKAGPKPIRLAAIRALPEIGHASAMPVLLDLMKDPDREIAQLSQENLASLPGQEVDAAIVAMLKSNNTDQQLTGIEFIVRRRMTACVPALLQLATSGDPQVRPTASKRLGELAGAGELPAVLDLLMKAKEPRDVDAAEQAVAAVCAKADNPESFAGKLIALLPQAQPAQRIALLRILGGIGGADGLKAVLAAVHDQNTDASIRTAAIRVLGGWKTADAAPDLLALAKTAGNPTDKTLCLRAYIGMASRSDLPAAQRLAMCREASGLVERDQEKKLLLGALGSISSLDSLALIMPYLESLGTKDEACAAAVAVAEKLLQGRNTPPAVAAKLVDPLQKVSQAATNADLANRAKTLLQQAQRRAGTN